MFFLFSFRNGEYNMKKKVKIAKNLVKSLGLKNGFDIEKLVRELGGRIIYVNDPDIDAYLEKHGEGFRIYLDINKGRKRQRFSIAHELGHLFLHLDYLNRDYWEKLKTAESRVFRFGHDAEELEANEFAAELLMPEDEFCKYIDKIEKDGVINIRDVAKFFDVSVDAVNYRGYNLRLWEM